MFGPLGFPELLFILVLALLVFGPKRLPEVGRTVGRALGEFRRATGDLRRSINTEIALSDDDERERTPRRPAAAVEAGEPPAGDFAAVRPEDGGGPAAPAEVERPPPPGTVAAGGDGERG